MGQIFVPLDAILTPSWSSPIAINSTHPVHPMYRARDRWGIDSIS